jgi:serine/threonine protein kinase
MKKGRTADEEESLHHAMETAKWDASNLAGATARKEAKYHRLLGQPSYYFTLDHSKHYMLTTWRSGVKLDKMSPILLLETSIDIRLRCLWEGFSDLTHIHSNHRVHADLHHGNFIIDLSKGTLRIIDFGSTNKIPLKAPYLMRHEQSDGYSYFISFCDDIYSMGLITAMLFPEYFEVSTQNLTVTPVPEIEADILGKALKVLYDTLRHPDRKSRCLAEDARDYSHQLWRNFPTYSTGDLQKMAEETILRKNIEVRDVLRERVRKP